MSYKTLDIARSATLHMAAAVFILMGGTGLLTYWLDIVYPLRGVLLPDNALAVLMVGCGLLALMLRWSLLRRFSAFILLAHVTYLLVHNTLAGGREVGVSWLTGDVRMGSLASAMLLLVALCLLLGVGRRFSRGLWAGVGVLLLSSSLLALLRLFLPGGEIAWTLNNASSPLLGTVLALLLGISMLCMVASVERPQPRLGRLALACGLFGVLLSCTVWYLLNWQYQENKRLQAGHLLDNLQYNAEQVMAAQLLLAKYMAERLDGPAVRHDEAMREYLVERYLSDAPGMQAVGLWDRGEWRWLNARHAAAGQWLEAQPNEPGVEAWLQLDATQPRLLATGPEQSGRVLTAVPLASTQQLLGSMDLAVLFEEALRVQLGTYKLRVLREGTLLLDMRVPGRTPSELSYPLMAQRTIELPGGVELTLELYPDSVSDMLEAGLIPGGVALAGLLLSYLMAFSLGLAHQRNRDRRSLWESEQRYRSLFAYNPDGVFSVDPKGIIATANPTFAAITGLPVERVVGMHFSPLSPPGERERIQQSIDEALKGNALRHEVTILDQAGETRMLYVTLLPILVEGVAQGVFGIAKDVTEQHRNETRLRVLERSVQASINGIVITDASQHDLPISYVNEAFLALTGYREEEVLGRNCRMLQGVETEPDAVAWLRRCVVERRDCHVTLLNYRKDGSTFWNALYVSPVLDGDGGVTHFVGELRDVSERHAYEERLAHSASHDALTGLANRSLLEERLNVSFAMAQRQGRNLAVLFVDLDDFKPINDSLGHAIGDQVLIEVAGRLCAAMGPGDTVGRLGGDEFVVLMPGATLQEQADMAESLLRLVALPYGIEHHELHLSASIGIAISDETTVQPMELIQQADMAMYLAKQQGRNAYQWFTRDITLRVNERLALRNELQDAIDGNRLELHYQPLCDQAGEIVCVEALLRWPHPDRGFVSPAEFIPLAEKTGQIMAIGRWVLERACLDMEWLGARGYGEFKVAVNLSPMQFHRAGFLEALREILAATALPASRLELELTEGVLLKDAGDAVDILHALRDMGVDVSIDDFGTGFSSLNYLKHLPISKIKIDRSFIKEVTENLDDASIVQAIVSMAHHLGLTVVAEGVETEQQLGLLKRYGCQLFQGFLLARPMPRERLEQALKAGSLLFSEEEGRH
ncbi:putative bifunctional diguanylate cyclase/phosphodiesterase [Billgrantia aerodenitrificans]|uniref:EAL domain-containing protein n=1 Tax=Billgrantia aerodenitrificans TaxID=2733483 RepID=A0ABS9ARI7_9GAMM|nr:bifunctional diguanylate cyclase/phosphodiesterase [Halomonas aerodenitrificans]MCE8024344.1 EAL domain-containing protein [Halomonas aerodenitrificans]